MTEPAIAHGIVAGDAKPAGVNQWSAEYRMGTSCGMLCSCRSKLEASNAMRHLLRVLLVTFVSTAVSNGPAIARAADRYIPFEGEKSTWHGGFDRYDFLMDEGSLE